MPQSTDLPLQVFISLTVFQERFMFEANMHWKLVMWGGKGLAVMDGAGGTAKDQIQSILWAQIPF